jgi:predicted SprT family Zn-dependent metalloprotease
MSDLNRVRVWAEALIRLHLDESWTFGFDNAKRRAGQCDFRTKRITVSRYLAARFEDDDIHQVLLHEVAHALAGHRAAHGPAWRRIARELGYVGGATHHGETAEELAPWVGTCPSGHVTYRHRRPTRDSSSPGSAARSALRRGSPRRPRASSVSARSDERDERVSVEHRHDVGRVDLGGGLRIGGHEPGRLDRRGRLHARSDLLG